VFLLSSLPSSSAVSPHHDRASLEMCTWRLYSSEFRDAPGGSDRASWEMHVEAGIKLVWRYALGGHDCANLEAVTEGVWRFNWRL